MLLCPYGPCSRIAFWHLKGYRWRHLNSLHWQHGSKTVQIQTVVDHEHRHGSWLTARAQITSWPLMVLQITQITIAKLATWPPNTIISTYGRTYPRQPLSLPFIQLPWTSTQTLAEDPGLPIQTWVLRTDDINVLGGSLGHPGLYGLGSSLIF